ncbi:acyl carrier protein [Amycolatopsis minnesotensis]|uniref:Phosphopantetheine-binding protein n=1 Tax=Amycolatopsis minnesotensis TaxID=337894 RepID=A0ABN2S1A2_9PSEU
MSDATTIQATDRARVTSAIGDALAGVLDYELPSLTEETRLFDELGLDSTGVLELLMQLEETLDIELEADGFEMSDFHTVGSLADFVTGQL